MYKEIKSKIEIAGRKCGEQLNLKTKPNRDINLFGLPSTIRTCDLRLRSFKNEAKQH